MKRGTRPGLLVLYLQGVCENIFFAFDHYFSMVKARRGSLARTLRLEPARNQLSGKTEVCL